jgi:protoporphyrinogen IX oxidase
VNHLTGFLGPAYLWVKAAHLTFVIFWLAGLFLLPRFYVYHQETVVGSPEDRSWIERETRVRSIILTPAMLLVWILGLMLAFDIGAWGQGWFSAKLALVVALSAYQGWLGVYGKKLANGERPLSARAVRMINEIPGIAAALIVVLVIVRPF